MHKSITTVAALSVAALTLGVAGTANADGIGIADPKETNHGSDLRAVVVDNYDRNVVVRTTHTNLRRDFRSGTAGAVYIDTDRNDAGPEYVFSGGYYEGTDYRLLKTEGFGRRNWGNEVRTGTYRLTIDYEKERVRMQMSRAALGFPGRVRVAVRVSGTRTDGSSVVDWLREPRSFTPWVARG